MFCDFNEIKKMNLINCRDSWFWILKIYFIKYIDCLKNFVDKYF